MKNYWLKLYNKHIKINITLHINNINVYNIN